MCVESAGAYKYKFDFGDYAVSKKYQTGKRHVQLWHMPFCMYRQSLRKIMS